MRMRHLLSLFAIIVGIVPASPAATKELQLVPVTVCGQIVPNGAIGYLTGDLDCTGYTGTAPNLWNAGAAVNLGRKSKLDLRGFTLTGGIYGVRGDNVYCGPHPEPRWHLRNCSPGPHEVYGGTIVGTPESTAQGIAGNKLIVHDVVVSGYAMGVYAYSQLTLSDSQVSGASQDGANGGRTKIYRSTITDNGLHGVTAIREYSRLLLVDSVVTGNGTDMVCAMKPRATCNDVYSKRFPTLVETTCNASGVAGWSKENLDWDVCVLD